MNGKEELALVSADVAAITGQDIADTILELAYPKFVLSQLYKKVKIPDGHKSVVVPLRPSASILVSQNVTEGSSITLSSYSFTGQTVSASKQGIRCEINNEALESSKRELLNDLFSEASNEWARVQELNGLTVCLDLKIGTISSWTGGTLGSSTFTPIINILTASSGVTITNVDYPDGKVALASSVSAGTVTFTYSNMAKNNGLYSAVKDAGTLSVWDVFKLRSSLCANSVNPDVVLVNDIDLPTMLYSPDVSDFLISIKEYTSQDGILNGEIGLLPPLRVLSSPLAPQGAVLILDSSRLGFNCFKRELEGSKEDRSEIDSVWYHLWSENTFVVADTLAIGVLVNAKTGQYPAANL